MKRTLKKQQGITLIALIITIIVLLILAVVSIGAIREGGVITHAQDAASDYEKEQELERVKLAALDAQIVSDKITEDSLNNALKSEFGEGNYTLTGTTAPFTVTIVNGTGTEYTIDENGNVTSSNDNDQTVGKWTQTEDGITDGEVTLQIGDYVDYDEGTGYSTTVQSNQSGYTSNLTFTTENLGWRVLGINDKGQLELISDNPIASSLTLKGETGYLNAENVLNNMCNELYGKGTYASSARSLNVDDINKLANYDPKTNSGYGDIWTYRFPTSGDYMQYKRTGSTNIEWRNITNTDYQTFRLPGETNTINSSNRDDNGVSLEYTGYIYSISNYMTQTASDGTKLSDIVTKGTGSSNVSQWLASRCVICDSNYARFYVRGVGYGSVNSNVLYYSYGSDNSGYCRARPVVTLQSDIQLSGNSTDGWTIQ